MTDHDPRLTTDDVPDEIERSIHIDATAETFFAIVCEPGWYINDGEYREHEVTTDGAVSTVVDPVHGTFSIVTEALEPPRRAVFRWLSGASAGAADDADASSTVVEFTIRPDGPTAADGVQLTVREHGFSTMSADAAVRRTTFEENSRGWIEELEVARTVAEAAR
ncbi:polyketide cyclase [Brachybacterium tyrofermentans]|uniref:Polyketide cyclase n=1 Tax=Brachybacterium tyrofermentans TaxID=47848 RepID=A0ABW0FI93_9MICO